MILSFYFAFWKFYHFLVFDRVQGFLPLRREFVEILFGHPWWQESMFNEGID